MQPPLIPPYRFLRVESSLFRGAYPTLRNLRFLRRLQLRTIVSFTPEPPTADLVRFCEATEVALIHVPSPTSRSSLADLQAPIAQILNLLVDANNLPLYLHCLDGRKDTSLIVLLLRRLQHWSQPAYTAEFAAFSGSPYDRDIEKFAMDFSETLTIPERIPDWLWRGDRESVASTIKLQFDPPLAGAAQDAAANTHSNRLKELQSAFTEAYTNIEDEHGQSGGDVRQRRQRLREALSDHPEGFSRQLQGLSLHGMDLPGSKWRETHERDRRRRIEAHQRRTEETAQQHKGAGHPESATNMYPKSSKATRRQSQASERPRSGSVREQPFR